MICILDGKKIENREMLHDLLIDSLGLPEWYGRNLDALYDCLTDVSEEMEIQFLHTGEMEERLGSYAVSLMKAVRMAAEDNRRIHLNIEDD